MTNKRASSNQGFYLEHIKLTSFGRYANMIVGPFGPGINVVYGPNETGKTTLNELVKGVLFGWPSARGETNPYRPENSDRVGSLFFKNTQTGDVVELNRIKNTDELQAPSPLLTNIDKETYETMFSLTSDELLRLDRHSDITARLLTAGSGTSASPAHALDAIKEQIKVVTSRSAQNKQAIKALRSEQTVVREQLHNARQEADELCDQESVLDSLYPRRETLQQTQERLNAEIDQLSKMEAQLDTLDASLVALENELKDGVLLDEADSDVPKPEDDIASVAKLTQAEEYCLRDSLDTFDVQSAKLEHAVDNARSAATASRAEFELHVEDGHLQQQYEHSRKQRWIRFGAALVIALLLAFIGVGLLLWSDTGSSASTVSVPSPSYSMMGVGLIVVGCILVFVGVATSIRPSRTEEQWEEERAKKEWVMQQDRKTLEVCEQEAREYNVSIKTYLDEHGLSAAQGSTKRARWLLDKVREYRGACEVADQAHQSRALRFSALRQDLEQAKEQRRSLCLQQGFPEDATGEEVRRCKHRKIEERSETAQELNETERQIGEISERLSAARKTTNFDELKMRSESIETRLSDSYRKLAVLLLAQQSLEDAIAQWEKKSQPEVYRCASRLFSQMTNGSWQTVCMNAEGDIEVVDAIKTTRLPHLLSLGTRQQLYLSLRIALLMTAENVGRGLPIMCDDILVNFDPARREQAVKALIELARKRQVILFTCHPDVASLVCNSDSNSKLLEL